MRSFGSAWWHVPLIIAAVTFIAPVTHLFLPGPGSFIFGVLVSGYVTILLVWRDRRVYLPRRVEAQTAGLIKWPDRQWPYAVLAYCALIVFMQIVFHRPHHSQVGTTLTWIGIVGMTGGATWQLVFKSRPIKFRRSAQP